MGRELLPSLRKNFFLSTFYQVLCIITPFITAPYASRILGADGIGVYSYTHSIQSFFGIFAALGVGSYGSYMIARHRNNKFLYSKLFWEILILSSITTVVCLIAWGVYISVISEYKIVYVILTINLLDIPLNISWFYTGLEQLKYTVTRNTFIKLLGIVLLFVFIKKPSDLILYIILLSVSNFVGTISMWLPLRKFICRVSIKELNVFSHFRETLIYFLPTIATSVYTLLDKALIGIITKDSFQSGYYEQATKMINIIKALTFSSLNAVFSSRTTYLFSQGRFEEIKEKISFSMNYIFFMGIGFCFGLLGCADIFVPIFFGKGYDQTIDLLYILSPVAIVIGVSNCLGMQYYRAAGKRIQTAVFLIIGCLVNLVLNILLIPKFHSYGAAVGTIVAESLITILYFINCNKYYTLQRMLGDNWKKLIAGMIMFSVLKLLHWIPVENDIIILLLQVFFGCIVYIAVLYFIKDSFVKTIVQKIVKKIQKRGDENEE